MESLNSDEKMQILLKLDGKEIVKVCQANKNMMKICSDDRYKPLWSAKISEEFKVKLSPDEDGFNKYRELHILSSSKLYIVVAVDTQYSDESFTQVFYTLESAEDYIAGIMTQDVDEDELQQSFENIINELKTYGMVDDGNYRYIIEENKFNIRFDFNKQREIMNAKNKILSK